MTTTQNLHLPQWEESDRIMRTDFNDAMQSIDTALAGKCGLMAGIYRGNGFYCQTIDLGVTPKAVFVLYSGRTLTATTGSPQYGGLAVTGYVGGSIEITDGGFKAYGTGQGDAANMSNAIYNYIVLY